MSEQIKVGDLVCVVRTCCHAYHDGRPYLFSVHSIAKLSEKFCRACGGTVPEGAYASEDDSVGVPVSWLKKIPPLSELESEDRKQEIEA